MTARRAIAFVGLVIGGVTLIAHFGVTVSEQTEAGHSAIYAIIRYFSFFTILTNIAMVLIYLAALTKGKSWLAPFRTPFARASAAAAITLVMLFFHFFIAPDLDHQGLLFATDTVLHYVTPLIFLIWFVAFNRSGTLKFSVLPKMLVLPLIYLVWSLLRGIATGDYIYAVLDVNALGYPKVALGALGTALALTVLNAGAVAVDKSLIMSRSS